MMLPWVIRGWAASVGRRQAPASPRRILVAHHLLAGDTLMLTPLLAKLRERFPDAALTMTVAPGLVPLYAGLPYGVEAVAFAPRRANTLAALLARRGFDLALVPGDNRYSWLALALGARWIVAFAGDRPAYKSWPVDEERPYSDRPMAWGDMVAALVDGPPPAPYRTSDWPDPACAPFQRPNAPYAVLHVEASTPLKHWAPQHWRALADALVGRGLRVVWSAGPDGKRYIETIDPQGTHDALGWQLDLSQLWHLVKGAAVLVCPDTSVSHIGRLTGTPTVTLFGPSSATLFGPGVFWRDQPFRAVTVDPFPCRDQRTLFKRELAWVRRCQRSTAECAAPRCMDAIGVDAVARALGELL